MHKGPGVADIPGEGDKTRQGFLFVGRIWTR
jgi:hypothetical protein